MELENKLLESLRLEETYNHFRQLDKNQILEKIIPQVKDMKYIGECKYHVVNAYEHSLYALEELECMVKEKNFFPSHLQERIEVYLNTNIDNNLTKFQLLKLGVFLHDIGKPDSNTIDKNGRVHFKGHEIVGEKIALNLGKELKLSSENISILSKYVKYHMILLLFYKTNDMSKEVLFEKFNILEEDIIGILLLGYADIVSTRKLLNPEENSEIIKTYMNYILTNYIYRYNR
ncbi:MAG: HD domain-containing protein [Romboutsia sp.]